MESNKRTYDFAFNSPPNTPQTDDHDHDDAPLQAVPINYYNSNDQEIIINILDEDDGNQRGQQEQQQQPNAVDAERQLLLQVVDHIRTEFGYEDVTDLKIVYDRKLTCTDAKDQASRLAIVRSELRTTFLTPSEDLFISWKDPKGGNLKIPVKVIVGSSEYDMSLTRWNYHQNTNKDDNNNTRNKAKNSSSSNNNNVGWKYVLNKKRSSVMKENNLKEGDTIILVSFRSNNYIHLAILKQTTMMGADGIPEYLVNWPHN